MCRKPRPMPYFFKVICSDDFTCRMSLSPIIGQKCGDVLSEKIKLRTSSGRTWNVKLERTGNEKQQYFLSEGWSKFVEDCGLRFGEFIMFCFREKFIFDVFVFGSNECEREILGCNLVIDVSDEEDEGEMNKDCIVSKISGGVKNNRKPEARETTKDVKSMEDRSPLYFERRLTAHSMLKLYLVRKFIVAAGLRERRNVKVEYMGNVHEIGLSHRVRYRLTELTTGWRRFSKENLVCGKTYSFEFNPSLDVIQIKLLDTEKQK